MSVWDIRFGPTELWQPVKDWEDVQEAFDNLDKHPYLNLCLKDGMRYMKVYGGAEDRVLVAFTNVYWDQPRFVLYDQSQTQPTTIYSLEYNEVLEYLPPAVCIDKALANRALKHFYETQEQLEDVEWGEWPCLWELQINRDSRLVGEWNVIEAAIDAMDNMIYAYVGLSCGNQDERAMEVYGGNQGRLYLTFTDQGDEVVDAALRDRRQKQPIEIFNGLSDEFWDDLPPQLCVDKSLAKRALKHFFETWVRDPTLDWSDV